MSKIEESVTYLSDKFDSTDANKTDLRRTVPLERYISAMKERVIDPSNRARQNNLALCRRVSRIRDTSFLDLEDGVTDDPDATTTPASYAAAAGPKAPPKVPIHRFVERFILRHIYI